MQFPRSSGIILHPSSLPGPDGIGDLGPEAYRWVNFLAEAGCSLWQVLPLGPTGYGDSPYQCFSAFAGNPYLVSPAVLLDEGLLSQDDLLDRPAFQPGRVDFGPVIDWKLKLLERAFKRFKKSKSAKRQEAFEDFQKAQSLWLPDFALFMAIKESQGGVSWVDWPDPLRLREPKALEAFREGHADDILRHTFRQFVFFNQWIALKAYANAKGIAIIGDMPIFVSFDSADAWSNPELFHFDKNRKPTVVAGVPPDYFSPTGQLWGNPLYRWEYHTQTGYAWWLDRLRAGLQQVDILRVDHFRGFAGYWEVPFGSETAVKGRWVPAPGMDLFATVQKELGNLPIIAEDLGEITVDVDELRDSFNLPGMKILQFGFDAPENDFLPHNYPRNCVAYTGTHDNDTSRGWYATTAEKERDLLRRYLARSGEDVSWDMIRAVWGSVADMVLAPLQDFLSLGGEARMNFPGRPSGNWSWRMDGQALSDGLRLRIAELNFLYSRLPEGKRKPKAKKTTDGYFL
ncbi:MAG: 4-alpha-glucanotransferase [Anaerolineaceae bacterium]|nr:4-alpha-glucanotransferase [Anaerolineaceae bacterium]